MNSPLDKTVTFSLRQVLRWSRNFLLVVVPVYFFAMVWHGWALETGGVAPNSSPYRSMIPEECVAFADRNAGIEPDRQWGDALLFRTRTSHIPITALVAPHAGSCYGYAVIAGLHGGNRGAGFIDVYDDLSGKPVVTVTVTYHQRYVPLTQESKQ